MHIANRAVMFLMSGVVLVPSLSCATITGNVRGADSKPFMGAFVIAENAQNKMTTKVLSDERGRYYIGNLPASTYTVRIRAIGYRSDPRAAVQLGRDQKASFDFALQKEPVRWSDLNTFQGTQLLPETQAHNLSRRYQDSFFVSCLISCHSFQSQMATKSWNEDGWRAAVKYMRDQIMAGEGGSMNDEKFEDIVSYLTTAFGPNSPKPQSPEALPEYKSLVRTFSPRSMNIAYVEYDFGAAKGLGPWSAVEDKDGMLWIPYYGARQRSGSAEPKDSRA